jgi:hypothetical protein
MNLKCCVCRYNNYLGIKDRYFYFNFMFCYRIKYKVQYVIGRKKIIKISDRLFFTSST